MRNRGGHVGRQMLGHCLVSAWGVGSLVENGENMESFASRIVQGTDVERFENCVTYCDTNCEKSWTGCDMIRYYMMTSRDGSK